MSWCLSPFLAPRSQHWCHRCRGDWRVCHDRHSNRHASALPTITQVSTCATVAQDAFLLSFLLKTTNLQTYEGAHTHCTVYMRMYREGSTETAAVCPTVPLPLQSRAAPVYNACKGNCVSRILDFLLRQNFPACLSLL